MNKRALQSYAIWAKNNLESQIEVSLKTLGINSEKDIKTARKVGDYTIIDGDSNSYPGDLKEKRDSIVKLITTDGYKQVIEEFAYTWFNRIVALRFMEVHDFLPHGFRVLSSRDGGVEPEIMKHLGLVKDELKLDLSVVQPLYAQGKLDEAYSYVLFRQCRALSGVLPMMFDREQDYLELLLPKALLKGKTFITKLMEIDEEDFLDDVEIIGWLYQFYVASDRQELRDLKVITKDMIPTLTQVFTPDWIVRFMAENSVGRIWLESYPDSVLKNEMKYYVEDVEQEAEVEKKLDEVKYKNVNPEDIKIIEPCCGSGHILVYVFDLLYKMYEEKGYPSREIPTLILKNNITGLEIDKRAAQLASFSLIMKARSVNSRFFNDNYYVVPEVYEILDSRVLFHSDYLNQIKETKLLTNQQIKDIEWLAEQFRFGKTIGSLLIVEDKNFKAIEASIDKLKNEAVINIFNSEFLNEGIKCLRHLLRQAEVMHAKYDVQITNPPYLGISNIEANTKKYLQTKYPASKTDMFAMFMETRYVKKNGFIAMVNPDSWMFLSSFEDFRSKLLKRNDILTLGHMGLGVFDAMVRTVMFVLRNTNINSKGLFIRLVDAKDKNEDLINRNDKNTFILSNSEFNKLPGKPIAFWVSKNFLHTFDVGRPMNSYVNPKQGLATANNDLFLRLWYEVDINKTCIGKNKATSLLTNKKWIPYNKGGERRNWYGNYDYVVNWENNGYAIKHNFDENGKLRSRPQNTEYYLKDAISWNDITTGGFSIRYRTEGSIHDVTGMSAFSSNKRTLMLMLGLMSTKLSNFYFDVLNPTVHLQIGNFCSFPVILPEEKEDFILEKVTRCLNNSITNWDSFETSWNFKVHPLIGNGLISKLNETWENRNEKMVEEVRINEEMLNELFISVYGLTSEIDYHITSESVTLLRTTKEKDIKSLISYLIGIEMGRYSLDVEGLAYAGGEWNPMNYVTYQPDDDGIIPVYPQLGMEDGLTARIIKLIKHIYGEDTYKENIDFIADALGKKNNESSEETLNRYLNEGFYADHLKIYQKRPIYWMFSSGKNDAFKCLIYLHRYNEDTLAKINSKYFLNESARLNAEVSETRTLLEAAEGREKLRLDKQMKLLTARQKEMIEYGQVLDHMASKYINLDLDDGVKVNYAKFQGIEIVNDSGAKVKKDLLVPIK